MKTNVMILGSGPAGYTAAIYAARAGLKPLLVSGPQPGGQLTITTDVENWPGDVAVTGPELMDRMRRQAEHCGTAFAEDIVTSVDMKARMSDPNAPIVCAGDSGETYETDALIIATGAKARWLGIPMEAELMGRGVSACATCDGFFFRGKTVAVVGGGNVAVEEALYLANLAEKVYLIHRRDTLRAEKVLQDRLMANPKIVPIWNVRVSDFLTRQTDFGTELSGLRLASTIGLASELMSIDVDGCFIAIGHDPATKIFEGQVEMKDGYIRLEAGSSRTSVPGVFAAGDCADDVYRQAVTSAGAGCMAALDAARWLEGR